MFTEQNRVGPRRWSRVDSAIIASVLAMGAVNAVALYIQFTSGEASSSVKAQTAYTAKATSA